MSEQAHPIPTVAALVIGPDGRALLVRTTKWSGLWGLPGGKVELGESQDSALRREVIEETGLRLGSLRQAYSIDLINDPDFFKPTHFTSVQYVAMTADAAVVPNEEIEEWAWITPDDVKAYRLNDATRDLIHWAIEQGVFNSARPKPDLPSIYATPKTNLASQAGFRLSAGISHRPVALVTGSAKGIGRAILLGLAGAGFDVAVHYRLSTDAAETVRADAVRLGANAVAFTADVTDPTEAARLVRAVEEHFGRLDVLVNNVGNYVFKPLVELSDKEWGDMINSNLSSAFYTMRAAIPIMRARGGGRIVNIGYAGAQNLVARPSLAAYALAKTGVLLLTKAVAKAEAVHGICANVVAPGVMENSVTKPSKEIPAGRVGLEDEVAAAVRFFVSPAAAYITGQTLEVAGGWNL